MRVENIAANYDLFTGKSTIINPPLDEIHTGTIWNAASKHYRGNDPNVLLHDDIWYNEDNICGDHQPKS
jgi:hypothetical protein